MYASGGSAAVEATINSLRSLLSDREHQLSKLEADLAIAKAYSGSSQRVVGESAQGESALRIELGVLRQRLSEKEAQVISGEERLSRLEAVHRVAQVCFSPYRNFGDGDASRQQPQTDMKLCVAGAAPVARNQGLVLLHTSCNPPTHFTLCNPPHTSCDPPTQ